MPFTFPLPTTSHLKLTDYFRSDTHPSLILTATRQRNILRGALKNYKKLSSKAGSRRQTLLNVLDAIDNYLPYLEAIDAGLSRRLIHDEEIDVVLLKDPEVEWRSPLALGRLVTKAARVKGQGLEYELAFVLQARACVATLQAKLALQPFSSSANDIKEVVRKAAATAKEHLVTAASIHQLVLQRGSDGNFPSAAIDLSAGTQHALAELAHAEATLMFVLAQDPYPASVLQSRDKDDKEWMYKAQDIPKVRAALFARLALRAAERAETSRSTMGATIVNSLTEYVVNLIGISKAKACRFLAIDAKIGDKIGEALGWLNAGKKFLGYKIIETETATKVSSLSKLKIRLAKKNEDKKATNGFIIDGGRSDEAEALDMLIKEFENENDMIKHQIQTPSEKLIASMPSGRDAVVVEQYTLPTLDPGTIALLRAPPDPSEQARLDRDTASDSDDDLEEDIPGAFPAGQSQSSNYY